MEFKQALKKYLRSLETRTKSHLASHLIDVKFNETGTLDDAPLSQDSETPNVPTPSASASVTLLNDMLLVRAFPSYSSIEQKLELLSALNLCGTLRSTAHNSKGYEEYAFGNQDSARAFINVTIPEDGECYFETTYKTIKNQPIDELRRRHICETCSKEFELYDLPRHLFTCSAKIALKLNKLPTESIETFSRREEAVLKPIVMDVLNSGMSAMVGGFAGAGKTTFVKKILRESGYLNQDNTPAPGTLVVAHQGCAARNISGYTIDSIFRIPKLDSVADEKGKSFVEGLTFEATYENFKKAFVKSMLVPTRGHNGESMTRFDKLFEKFKDLKLIVIEEISMVTVMFLWYVQLLSRRIYESAKNRFEIMRKPDIIVPQWNRDNPFGHIRVIMLGDFTQIPCIPRFSRWIDAPAFAFFFQEINSIIPIGKTYNYRTRNCEAFGDFLSKLQMGEFDEHEFTRLNFSVISKEQWAQRSASMTLVTQNNPQHRNYKGFLEVMKEHNPQDPLTLEYFKISRDSNEEEDDIVNAETSSTPSPASFFTDSPISTSDSPIFEMSDESSGFIESPKFIAWMQKRNVHSVRTRRGYVAEPILPEQMDQDVVFGNGISPYMNGPELVHEVIPSPNGEVMITMNNSAFCLTDDGQTALMNGNFVKIKSIRPHYLLVSEGDKDFILPRIVRFNSNARFAAEGYPISSSQIISANKTQGLTLPEVAIDVSKIPYNQPYLLALMMSRGEHPSRVYFVTDKFNTIHELGAYIKANQERWVGHYKCCIDFMTQVYTQTRLAFNILKYMESDDETCLPKILLSSETYNKWTARYRAPHYLRGNDKRGEGYNRKINEYKEGRTSWNAVGFFDNENTTRYSNGVGEMITYSIGLDIWFKGERLDLRKVEAEFRSRDNLARHQTRVDINGVRGKGEYPGIIIIKRPIGEPDDLFCENELTKLMLLLHKLTYREFKKRTKKSADPEQYVCFNMYGYNSGNYDLFSYLSKWISSTVLDDEDIEMQIIPNIGASSTCITLSHTLEHRDQRYTLPFVKFLDISKLHGVPKSLADCHKVFKKDLDALFENGNFREYYIDGLPTYLRNQLARANNASKGDLPHGFIAEKGYGIIWSQDPIKIPKKYYKNKNEAPKERVNVYKAHDDYLELDVLINALLVIAHNQFTMSSIKRSLIGYMTCQQITTHMFLEVSTQTSKFTEAKHVSSKKKLTMGRTEYVSDISLFSAKDTEFVRSAVYGGKTTPRATAFHAKCIAATSSDHDIPKKKRRKTNGGGEDSHECRFKGTKCEVHKSEIDPSTCMTMLDIAGMYSSVLQNNEFPIGKYKRTVDPILCDLVHKSIVARNKDLFPFRFIARVVRKDNSRAVETSVPHRAEKTGGLRWTPKIQTEQILVDTDIETAMNDGSEILRVLEIMYFEKQARIYESFISWINDKRTEAQVAENNGLSEMFKLIANASYGATLKKDMHSARIANVHPGALDDEVAKFVTAKVSIGKNGLFMIMGQLHVENHSVGTRPFHVGAFVLGFARQLLQFLEFKLSSIDPTDFSDTGVRTRFEERVLYGDTDSIVIPVHRLHNGLYADKATLQRLKEKYAYDNPHIHNHIPGLAEADSFEDILYCVSKHINMIHPDAGSKAFDQRYVNPLTRRDVLTNFPLVLSYAGTYQAKGSLEEDLSKKGKGPSKQDYSYDQYIRGEVSLITNMSCLMPKTYSIEYVIPAFTAANTLVNEDRTQWKLGYKVGAKGLPKDAVVQYKGKTFIYEDSEEARAKVHATMMKRVETPDSNSGIRTYKSTSFKRTNIGASTVLVFNEQNIPSELAPSGMAKRGLSRTIGRNNWNGRRELDDSEKEFFKGIRNIKYATLPLHFSL